MSKAFDDFVEILHDDFGGAGRSAASFSPALSGVGEKEVLEFPDKSGDRASSSAALQVTAEVNPREASGHEEPPQQVRILPVGSISLADHVRGLQCCTDSTQVGSAQEDGGHFPAAISASNLGRCGESAGSERAQ